MVADEDAAIQAVRELSSDALQRRGPLTVFATTSEAERVSSLMGRAMGHVRYGSDRTWTAPSPWHAAVWLYNIAAGVPNNSYVWPYSGDQELRFDSALLFRGQRKAEWGICPSLFRPAWIASQAHGVQYSIDRYKEEVGGQFAALRRFVLALDWLVTNDVDIGVLPEDVHIATAQHYGLPTHFLDLSTDPLIATWFACSGAGEKDVAAVYWIPFSGNQPDLPVVLAPPWARRVHRQRGVFMNYLSGMDGSVHSPEWYRIIFPASPGYCSALDEIEPMYPENLWFEAAIAWAVRDIAAGEDGRELAERLVAEAGDPPFSIDAMIPARWAAWVDSFVKFCESLAIKVEDNQFTLACEPVQKIADQNPQIVSALRAGLQIRGVRESMSPDAFGGHGRRIIECLGL